METAIDLQLLVTFSAVAEQTSFSKAAIQLGVAKGTVSRSITELEALLGVELLHRTTHHVALSTAGASLYERTREHLGALRSALVDLPEREEEASGLLRLTAPPDFGTIFLPTIIVEFSRRFPKVRFDIRLSNQRVDLVKEGFDLAIRAISSPLKDSTLKTRRLGRGATSFYASPSYLARRGRPKEIGDERHHWILHPGIALHFKINQDSILASVDDFFLARGLIRDGLGVGMLPNFVAKNYVREGLLQELPQLNPAVLAGELVMLYPSSGQIPKKVTVFRDFLVESLNSELVLSKL